MKKKHTEAAFFLPLILPVILSLMLCSCGLLQKEEPEAVSDVPSVAAPELPEYNISIVLPNTREHKWLRSAKYIEAYLAEWNYRVNMLYAGDDAKLQASLIDGAVSAGDDCIIVAAVDSYSSDIREAAERAKSNGVPVIAYDRLIMDTEAADVFIAFDPYLTGRMCGQYLESALNLGAASANAELFLGSAADASSYWFNHGALDILMPHVDAGRLNIPSRLMKHYASYVSEPEELRRMTDARIEGGSTGGVRLQGVLAADDALALAAIESLEQAGYDSARFPVVVGVGCHAENIMKMSEGKQAMSVFTDERLIAEQVAIAVDQLVHGSFPSVNDKLTFFNGKKTVPAILLEPVMLDVNNYKDLLIGGDYYSYTDINPE